MRAAISILAISVVVASVTAWRVAGAQSEVATPVVERSWREDGAMRFEVRLPGKQLAIESSCECLVIDDTVRAELTTTVRGIVHCEKLSDSVVPGILYAADSDARRMFVSVSCALSQGD